MRTTVRLDPALLERAKKAAAQRHTTLTALLEEGLQLALARRDDAARQQQRVSLPVSSATGGTLPGIDLNDTAALLDVMEASRR
jgi:hypothetical protein